MTSIHRQTHLYIPANNQRLDRFLYRSPGQPVFFTVRAYRQSSPFDDAALAAETCACLMSERDRCHVDLYAYCLMPEHLHLVTCPRKSGADALTYVDRFKGKSTRIAWAHGIAGKLWQPRSYDHLVRREESLIDILQYVLDNPVRRGLSDRWEDYPWCGLVDPVIP